VNWIGDGRLLTKDEIISGGFTIAYLLGFLMGGLAVRDFYRKHREPGRHKKR
jgi:hypothetical protein